jgi:hypothetical protein
MDHLSEVAILDFLAPEPHGGTARLPSPALGLSFRFAAPESKEGLEERFKKLLSAPVFFVGMVFGFLACCVAGRFAVLTSTFHEFHRFHQYLSPETLYFPTALQLRALAEKQLPPEKIAVIVGGSSVMQGIGQKEGELWTQRLQELLGDEYRVLNLAVPGGAPNEHGQIAAEMLLPTHPRLIYVCDSRIWNFAPHPDGNREVYRYLFHDARARGLLLDFPDRDAALAKLAPARRAQDRFDELQLRSASNCLLSFDDLWQNVGYEAGFTVWSPLTRKAPWRARRLFLDPPPNPYAGRRSLEEIYFPVLRSAADSWKGEEPTRFDAGILTSVPPALRSRMLVIVNRYRPSLVAALDEAEPGFRSKLDTSIQKAISHIRVCGLHAVEGCTSLDAIDYMDGNHLGPTGGAKLATELALVIREQAGTLGYLSRCNEVNSSETRSCVNQSPGVASERRELFDLGKP